MIGQKISRIYNHVIMPVFRMLSLVCMYIKQIIYILEVFHVLIITINLQYPWAQKKHDLGMLLFEIIIIKYNNIYILFKLI
jgi:hypothetical protein